jgi:prepilin-type N-terminal cleavage/methylation domain-containing protein
MMVAKKAVKTKLGFTLIEFMVVLALFGLLTALVSLSFIGTQKKGRDTKRKNHISQYRNALENYAGNNNGLYPVEESDYDPTGFCGAGEALDVYLTSCPDDPDESKQYHYTTDSQGIDYIISADIETGDWWYACGSGTVDTKDTQPDLTDC